MKIHENTVHSRHDIIARLVKSCYQTLKNPIFLLPSYPPIHYFVSSSSRRSTDTSVDTLFLHSDPIQPVCRCHRTATVCNDDKLCFSSAFAKYCAKSRDIRIIQCRLDFIQKQTKQGKVSDSGLQTAAKSPSTPFLHRKAASYSEVFYPAAAQ